MGHCRWFFDRGVGPGADGRICADLFRVSDAVYRSAGRAASGANDLYASGTTIFTLGLGDVVPRTAWPSREPGGAGVGDKGWDLWPLVIGYFPVLYGSIFAARGEYCIARCARGIAADGVRS